MVSMEIMNGQDRVTCRFQNT